MALIEQFHSNPIPVTISGSTPDSGETTSTPITVMHAPVGPVYAAGRALGVYASLTTAHTDTAIAIPDGAVGVTLTFYADGVITEGRIAWRDAATAITGLTGTDTAMGYHVAGSAYRGIPASATHLHVASLAADVIVKGEWDFAS